MSWNSIVIIITVLLAVYSVYREYSRVNKAHLIWRIIASLFAIVALACIALPLTYHTGATQSVTTGKTLLTDGFNADSISKTDSVYTLSATVHQQFPKAKLLNSVQQLFKDSAHVDPIHVFGYGLTEQELADLSGRPLVFHPTAAPDGFTAISWTEKVKTGQQFTAQGTYKNTSAKAHTLLLKGLNTTLDSVTIPKGEQAQFSLQATPKNSGRVVYNLIVLNGKDTLQQEHLPVIIERTQPLKVLMLSSSPDFESKFLRNWLGGNGYGVASRSNITKGKFGQEYLNMDQPDLTHISTALLSKFDMVIGDITVLKDLSPAETSALQQEMAQKGLGLIVRADSTDKKGSWLQNSFPVNYVTGKQAAPTSLLLQGKGKTAKLSTDPSYITTTNNTQSLITDEHSHSVAGVTLSGAGKMVFTTINNTYSWMLAGNKDDYTALWSLLIDKAARKANATENWSVANSLATANQPAQLVLESTLPAGDVKINQSVAYTAQNPAIPFQQLVTYWPAAYGWQQVVHQNTNYWWYTWQKDGWLSLKAAKKSALTAKYARHNPAIADVTKQIHQKVTASVPKIYFYILFLIAATFLWAESKFFS